MKIGLTGNIEREEVRDALIDVIKQLDAHNIEWVIDDRFQNISRETGISSSTANLGNITDVVLSFGGDGTLLYLAKLLCQSGTPLLGINMGHLGFLTEINLDQLNEKIVAIKNKEYDVEKRAMLESTVPSIKDDFNLAANDLVLDKGKHSRIIKIKVTVNGDYCHTYAANGLIVSTATGSTAYSLSAGGPIIYPSVENLLITPICPHTLSARPMIIPAEFEIELDIISGPEQVIFQADGQPVHWLAPGQKIIMRKSNLTFNLVHFPHHSFFQVLRNKLGWGTRNENDSLQDLG